MNLITYLKSTISHPRLSSRSLRSVAINPFRFQAEQGGLCWDETQISLAVVGQWRSDIRVIDTCTMPVKDTWQQTLSGLKQQYGSYIPPVVLGLNTTSLSYHLLSPTDSFPEDVPAWVVSQMPLLLPPGLRLADITLDFRVVSGKERPHIQVVWAQRERLNKIIHQTEKPGLCVAGIYPLALPVIENGLKEMPASSCLLMATSEITFVPLKDGIPRHLHTLAWKNQSQEPANEHHMADRIQSLLESPAITIVTDGATETLDFALSIQDRLTEQGVKVEMDKGLGCATALAHAGLQHTKPVFRLVPNQTQDPAQQVHDRYWALRLGLGGGALVTLSLIIGLIFNLYYDREQTRISEDLASKSAWISEVHALSKTQETLTAEVAALQNIQAGRTGVAGLMESLGQTIPDQLWLRSLRLERHTETSLYHARITGLARKESVVAQFLSNLEHTPVWQPGNTFNTNRIPPGTIQRQTGVRVPLIQFDLMIEERRIMGD